MCGIHLDVNIRNDSNTDVNDANEEHQGLAGIYHQPNLFRRGPDAQHSISMSYRVNTNTAAAAAAAAADTKNRHNHNTDGKKEEVIEGGSNNNSHGDIHTNSSSSSSSSSSTMIDITLSASVLQMRQQLITQPVRIQNNNNNNNTVNTNTTAMHDDSASSSCSYLCWNGELYQTLDDHDAWNYTNSDTVIVADLLQRYCLNNNKDNDKDNKNDQTDTNTDVDVTANIVTDTGQRLANKVLNQFYNAEYAFVLVTAHAIYYGRDPWGRRSLILKQHQCEASNNSNPCPSKSFQIVSTIEEESNEDDDTNENDDENGNSNSNSNDEWTEIRPGYVHMISLADLVVSDSDSQSTTDPLKIISIPIPIMLPTPKINIPTTMMNNTIPASLSEQQQQQQKKLIMYEELSALYRTSVENLLQPSSLPLLLSNINSATTATTHTHAHHYNISQELWEVSLILEYHLTRAVQMRMMATTSSGAEEESGSESKATAILFSGGLDSAVVAALAARCCYHPYYHRREVQEQQQPPLYLYNVSFGTDSGGNGVDGNDTTTKTKTTKAMYTKSADRKAALITFDVLTKQWCGGGGGNDNNENENENNNGNNTDTSNKNKNTIIFKDIIVSWEQLSKQEPHIRTLLKPKKCTVMDINIATALWFASSGGDGDGGNGQKNDNIDNDNDNDNDNNSDNDPSIPKPKVLLLGMGADEQMGGYGRHKKAYERGGTKELQQELDLDQNRFWERNLGRDDRICSDHGCEARYPFLDIHVTNYLKSLPLHLICDFEDTANTNTAVLLPPGQQQTQQQLLGDKRILRVIALRLGLVHASGLVKRAIQFGSRISHLSDTKRFGSRRKAKGQSTA